MKLLFFGTCSGTQPFPGRHHTSFAIEHRDKLYWFDAGETCSYTAHCMGVDLLKTSKIVISHTHMDHIGGLGNLLWNIRKINGITNAFEGRKLELFIPQIEAWEGLQQMLAYTEGGFQCNFTIDAREYADGIVFEEDGFRVTALHNRHIKKQLKQGEKWRSFGFLIEAEGKRIVYSGDTNGFEDFAPLLHPQCDILLMETGHHHPVDFTKELVNHPDCPKKLLFIHHGRKILDSFEEMHAGIKAVMGERVEIMSDEMVLEI
ncbi:MAG TPA: MBL fold metallo-hydrolase [Clostridia bacterium]|nr:MBL fold metallo-hydrolase [Clostridia bacterium]